MSDAMLFGVLRMPYELAMCTDLSCRQFYDRAQHAVDELERQSNNAAILAQQVADLTAERDALRADAERYWWLRSQHPVDALVSFPGRRDIGGISYRRWNDYRGDDLDAAIDAARGKP